MKPRCIPPFYRLSEYFASSMGLALNGILLILILFRTPVELRVYSRVLLCTCFFEMLFALSAMFIDEVLGVLSRVLSCAYHLIVEYFSTFPTTRAFFSSPLAASMQAHTKPISRLAWYTFKAYTQRYHWPLCQSHIATSLYAEISLWGLSNSLGWCFVR